MLGGLAQLNLELTSRCDKHTLCAFCGHQDPDIFPLLQFGDMDFGLLTSIRDQLPEGVTVQFHRDGEPTVYPRLGEALDLFKTFTTSIVTHGENLGKRAHEIINRCTTVTVSVFRGDPDESKQLQSVKEFIYAKGRYAPNLFIKIVGEYPDNPWEGLGVPVIHRLIHVPGGNYKYAKAKPTIAETGVCLDYLHHPSVDWQGRVFICNRLDPDSKGYLGSLTEQSLAGIWGGARRMEWLRAHQQMRRDLVPACKDCSFWGVPSGLQPKESHKEIPMVTA